MAQSSNPIAATFAPHDHQECAHRALDEAAARLAEQGARLTPVRRRTLEILLESHRALGAYEVLDRLAARTLADLEADHPDRPFADLDPVLRRDVFAARAADLGCGEAELADLACTAFQGLSHRAHGDLARAYLAPYFTACD